MTGRWPQPHEGIRGTSQDSWLLSLDERAVLHRELLISMALHLRTAVMVGSPAPVVRRVNERMRSPRPGDLVVTAEVLHGRRDPEDRVHGFGIFLAARREWMASDAEWAAQRATETIGVPDLSDEGRPTDNVFYIQYGPEPGDICRWHNSEAVVLPVMDAEFGIDPAAERDATHAVITRDSLAGSLADSGFRLRGMPGPVPDDDDNGHTRLVTVRLPDGNIVSVRHDAGGWHD
jgi:hypothetical protein